MLAPLIPLRQLLCERLMQQLASRGEGALLQRASGQMLDEMLADGLCRHAMRLARRQQRVQGSRVLGSVHRQLANRAMLEELLAQLQLLSASGLEGVGAGEAPPDETDSEEEDAGGAQQLSDGAGVAFNAGGLLQGTRRG